MNERIQKVSNETGSTSNRYVDPPKKALWEVLSADLRDSEFRGTYEQCVRYLKSQCSTGSCES